MSNKSEVDQRKINFLKLITNTGIIAAGATTAAFSDAAGNSVLFNTLRTQFGNDFNTLIVLNTDAVAYDVILDGETVTTVSASNGSFNIESRDGFLYNHLEIKNIDSSVSGVASKVRITVGRSGV